MNSMKVSRKQTSQPLGKNAKLVASRPRIQIWDSIESRLLVKRCARSSKVHEERRKPAYWVSSFPKFLLQSHLRRPLLKKTILGTSFSFSEQSAVVETKELFTSMAWRFNVSRATTVALALFLCLGLIQFSMAQNEVEVSIGRTISTNNNDLHSRKRTDST